MSKTKQRKTLTIPVFLAVYISVIVACIALDQLTKYFIGIACEKHGTIKILGNWLTLYWTTNPGATGGMFSNLAWNNWLFFFMTLIGIPVFMWLLWRSRTRSVAGQVAFAFIIGGTIGNAIDRIVFAKDGFFTGQVRDFVRVEGFFGIFNIADSFLVVGVILALVAIVFVDHDSLMWSLINERNEKLKQKQEQTDENDQADL
ncbi:MAG: signal peptidase II [Clostridiales bacterium]|nr:signal peptidase II [Clostridiales bacterium]